MEALTNIKKEEAYPSFLIRKKRASPARFLRYILHWGKERDKIGKIFLSARISLTDRE